MNRRDVMFSVLTTFCLCALAFSVLPIRSGQPYDPWADINDDGTINMKDIATVTSQFGTSGDSTKNVNVTNWNVKHIDPESIVIPNASYVSRLYDTDGYSQIVISTWTNSTGAVAELYEIAETRFSRVDTWSLCTLALTKAYPVRTSSVLLIIHNLVERVAAPYIHNFISVQIGVDLSMAPYYDSTPKYTSSLCNPLYLNASFNVSWTTGNTARLVIMTYPSFSGGFSKMFVNFRITGASREGSWTQPVLIYLGSIEWTDFGGYKCSNFFDKNTLNLTLSNWTFDTAIGPSFGTLDPIEVRGPYFYITVFIENQQSMAPSGWMTVDISYYLRND